MKRENFSIIMTRRAMLFGLMLIFGGLAIQAQTTAFTYQGRLTDGATQASGNYDLRFRLYDMAIVGTGTQIGADQTFSAATNNAVNVSNGVFTVRLDFGASPFAAGANRFLEIAVKKASETNYTILSDRQPLTASPYSIRTLSANQADILSANCVGCATSAQINSLDGAKVNGTVANANTATTATSVSGVVAIANGGTGSTTKNFVDLTTDQTIGGNKTFTGIISGDGSGLRNISGASVAGSTALNPQRLAILRWYDVNQAIIAQPITVGDAPIALTFDGTFVYVANFNNNVTRIRASTGAVEGSPIAVGNYPYALAFDGTFVYVANLGSDNVMRF